MTSQQSKPAFHSPAVESIDQLLALHDRAFVRQCYLILLRREPDAAGEAHYLERLRSGEEPLRVIREISGSEEGLRQKGELRGLPEALARHAAAQRSWSGRFRRWLNGDDSRRLRAVENQLVAVAADQQTALEQLDKSLGSLTTRLRSMESATGNKLWNLAALIENDRAARGSAPEASTPPLAAARLPLTPAVAPLKAAAVPLPRVATVSRAARKAPAAAHGRSPQFSIVMPVYKTPLPLLEKTLRSVLAQGFQSWELCICDDGSAMPELREFLESRQRRDSRIKLIFSERNGGIAAASNLALTLATGEFTVLLDHDDELTEDALEVFANVAIEDPEVDVIYSDQEKIDEAGEVIDAFYKPDWSPDYFRRVMYVGHLLAVKTDLMRSAGGFDAAFNRVQDYELMLRVSERARRIRHVSKVLYRWRAIAGSIAATHDAKGQIESLQCEAVARHLQRLGLPGTPVPHPTFPHRVRILRAARATAGQPRVSIIIPSKDHPEHIGRCLNSIFNVSTYKNIEVVVVDNGTTDREALDILRNHPVVTVPYAQRFNYSHANNLGAARANGDVLVLLNNDTEVLTPDWIEVLLSSLEQSDVGIVGPMLVYDDMKVQHAGIVIGARDTADHVMRHFPKDSDGYAGSLSCVREVSGVTGACLMTRSSTYHAVGGLSEHYGTHYQDVDFCLKVRKLGQRVLHVPDAVLIHYESATRGSDYDLLDRLLLQDTWRSEITAGDPYFNRVFSLSKLDYSLALQAGQ